MASVATNATSCSCSVLFPQLGKLREIWKHVPSAPVRDLDMAIAACGIRSWSELKQKGYDIPRKRLQACNGQKLRRKQRSKQKKKGRPSKANDPRMIAAVRAVLAQNSTASSNTCIVKEKQANGEVVRCRKQVRSLSALPATIYRSTPSLVRNLAERQFRCILAQLCKEFKRGRRKTDLCDHCITYRQKIIPRVREFLKRCEQELEAVCAGYWKPFYAHKLLLASYQNFAHIGRLFGRN